jgi:hypothetical protein
MSDSEPAVALTEEGNIEIILPKKSSKFPDKIASRIKASATLIVAISGLIAALAAWFKPADQSIPKASYEALSDSIKEISKQVRENHDDNLALKGFVDGSLGRSFNTTPLAYSAAPVSSAAPVLRPLPQIGVAAGGSRAGGVSRPTPSLSAAIASALTPPIASEVVPPSPPPTKSVSISNSVFMPDSPAIRPTPPAISPPSFDAVLKRAGQ